jgi:hypothetical protein
MSRAMSVIVLASAFAMPPAAALGQLSFSLPQPAGSDCDLTPEFLCGVNEPPAMPSLCFAPGTSPQVMEAVNTAVINYMNEYFPTGAQWGPQGMPISLTWSFVPDQLSIPGDPNVGDATAISTLFATMDSKFGGFGARQQWINQFQACFDRWHQLTGIHFSRIQYAFTEWDDGAAWGSFGNANRGDMRIAMHPIDGADGILAFCYFPNPNSGKAGDMVLDSAENWGSGGSYLFLRNTVTHELGHGLGLMHVCPSVGTKLMEPFLSLNYDGPQHDDIRGMQYLYGDTYEPNNTAAAATPLAAVTLGNTVDPSTVSNVTDGTKTSIEPGDEDWFKSSVATPMLATFDVYPVGSNYDTSTQNANGTCNSGNMVNSEAIADLAFEVRAADGTTVWESRNGTGAGAEEGGYVLLTPGNFYVRVFANGAFQGTQAYRLEIHGNEAPTLAASDGAFPGSVHLNWSTFSEATQYAIYRGTTSNRAQASFLSNVAPPTTTYEDNTVTVGTTYYYWVEAQQGAGGTRPYAGPDAGSASLVPVNDACANATTIGVGDFGGSTANATNDGSALCGNSNTSKDVWFDFVAPASGTVRITTCGTHDTGGVDQGMDTVLSIYNGCPGTLANQIACNDDAAGGACSGLDSGAIRDSALNASVAAGQHLLIRVAGYNGSNGAFNLHVFYLPPANDACAAAIPISIGATNFGTMGATTDGPDEPTSPCNMFGYSQIGSDVWFRYTATCTGTTSVTLCGSTFDTKMAVYGEGGGCPSGSGAYLACNDDYGGVQSSVSFSTVSGSDYLIRVGGYHGATGQATMAIACQPNCGSADFNCDGDFGTDADIEAFFACLAGTCPAAPCTSSADFNHDGDVGTDADIEAFFRVLAGGTC